jgi:hypothetical protein
MFFESSGIVALSKFFMKAPAVSKFETMSASALAGFTKK